MDKEPSSTIFTPIKKPHPRITIKPIDKKKYLDNLYTHEWQDNYFKLNSS